VSRRATLLAAILTAALAILTVNVILLVRQAERQASLTREHFFWVLCQPGHSPAERLTAFHHLVAEGNREWRSADLAELSLRGFSSPRADLQQAGFQRSDLTGANLAGAKLNKASFTLADLSNADLADATLSEAQCYRATLKNASFRHAVLRAAVLQEVKAVNADLMVADLSDADCLMADFSGANLSGANLTGARLERSVLKGVNLSLARLDGANLTETDFSDSNWWHARGFTTEQLDFLKQKFAPLTNAPAALRDDYQKWSAGK
jgi:uncharacterized protein YjbI with pentapeptide repeats